jgi:hypothetical protein
MDRKNIAALAVIAILAILISSVLSKMIFNSSKNHNLKVPVVQRIDSTFPDIKNDQNYKSVFNDKALDPTQLIQIGTGQNNTPFNVSQ